MIEYTYKVYLSDGDADYLRASNLSLEDAMIFVQALFTKFYAEDKMSYKIVRDCEMRDGM